MRKISAHFALWGSEFIKFPVFHFNSNGILCDIIKDNLLLKEEAGIEFYSGILFPGFKIEGSFQSRIDMHDIYILFSIINSIKNNPKKNIDIKDVVTFKSVLIGKKTGLVLLENVNLNEMSLTHQTLLRILI